MYLCKYTREKRGLLWVPFPPVFYRNSMRTIITLDGKKISKKAACEMFGEADMNKRIRDAKEAFFEDPHEESSWWMGNGMLTIEFR